MLQRARTILIDLARDTGGNVLPMAGAGILVMAALIGGGVDMSRAYKAQARLQAACDAGVLAGRKKVGLDGFDTEVQDEAERYFDANFNANEQQVRSTSFQATSIDDGNTVNGSASGSLEAIVMPIFGIRTIDISVACSASLGLGNSDIMMVLDTTGSMAWTADGDTSPDDGETSRLEDLQAAMKNFYDTVAEAASGSNTRIRYGFVPYSSSVNVGSILMDTDEGYVADSFAYQTRVWVRWVNPQVGTPSVSTSNPVYDNNWTRIDNPRYNTLSACNAARPANIDFVNNGSASNSTGTATVNSTTGKRTQTSQSVQPQRSTSYQCGQSGSRFFVYRRYGYRDVTTSVTTTWDPQYVTASPVGTVNDLVFTRFTMNTATYKTFAAVQTLTGRSGSSPTWVSSTWNGCIMERQTVPASAFSFTSGSGISPSEALDLDLDTPPDPSDPATQWAPHWPEISYYRTAGTLFSLSGTLASSPCPTEARLLAEMDEEGFDTYVDSLTATGSTYHDIGLIWGGRFSSPQGIWQDLVNEDPANGGAVSRHLIFMTDGELAPSTTANSSYGMERNDRRITDDGSTEQWDRHRSRFLAVCDAIRDKGIRLWVVAFGTGLNDDLRTCASTNSAFSATNASDLNEAFQGIARQVGELRVVQ